MGILDQPAASVRKATDLARLAARDKATQVILADTVSPLDVSGVIKPLATIGPSNATVYGLQAGSSLAMGRSVDAGLTFIAGAPMTGDNNVSAMCVMPTTGTILIAVVSGTASPATPAAVSAIWRSTNSLGTRTLVHDMRALPAPQTWYGYSTPFNFHAGVTYLGNGTPVDIAVAGEYGYKTGASGANCSRRVRASIDDGLTWTQILDNGDWNNQHVHCAMIDSRGWVWVTYGDVGGSNTSGTPPNPKACGVFRSKNVAQAITDGVPPTWDSWQFTYGGTARIAQALDIIDGGDGYMYYTEDANSHGDLFRFPYDLAASAPVSTSLEAMLSPDLGETKNFVKWSAGVYHMYRDANGTFWAYFVGELATSQGRIACSPKGKTWITVLNSGNTGVNPSSGGFRETNTHVYYNTWRFPKYQPEALGGFAPTQIQSRERSTVLGAPVTAGVYTEFIRLGTSTIGFSFRIVAVNLFVRNPTDTCSVQVTNAAGVNLLVTDPSVTAGSAGTARSVQAGIKRGPTQRIVGSDVVNVALTVGAAGATDITVTLLIEHEQQPHAAQIG